MAEIVLAAEHVSKVFGGVTALRDASFAVAAGRNSRPDRAEWRGQDDAHQHDHRLRSADDRAHLLSRQGFVRAVRGAADVGRVRRAAKTRAYRIGRMGIARTWQVVKPFQNMTVRENVTVGALFGKGNRNSVGAAGGEGGRGAGVCRPRRRARPRADELTIADRKRLELAKALAMEPEILLLDEVMAGLNLVEIERAMDLVRTSAIPASAS